MPFLARRLLAYPWLTLLARLYLGLSADVTIRTVPRFYFLRPQRWSPPRQRLQCDLAKESFDAWLDTQRIGGVAVWSAEIEREIDTRQVALALLSPRSYASEICRAEQLHVLDKGNSSASREGAKSLGIAEAGNQSAEALIFRRRGFCHVVQNHGETHASRFDLLPNHRRSRILIGRAGVEMQLHHALADVTGIGAGMNRRRGFDRDLRHQLAIGKFFGKIVTLPSPVLHMNARSLPLGDLRSERVLEKIGVFQGIGGFHIAFQNADVPRGVEIGDERVVVFVGPAAEVADRDTIAALVAVGGRMQRHV